MKKIFFIMLLTACSWAKAQNKAEIITSTLTVRGNCGECKERIENAADIKGVKTSNWDSKTLVLSITYKSDKVTLDQIKDAILKSGHDVGDVKAADQAYIKLPKCCRFRDTKCEQ